MPSRSSTSGPATRVPPPQSGHSRSFLRAAGESITDCLQWVPHSLPLAYLEFPRVSARSQLAIVSAGLL